MTSREELSDIEETPGTILLAFCSHLLILLPLFSFMMYVEELSGRALSQRDFHSCKYNTFKMTRGYVYICMLLLLSYSRVGCLPCGSTSFAIFRASELARSVFAGVTAKIRQLSLVMNCISMSLIWCSMSCGWSPTATLVIPGRSIRVRFSTE